jgi:Uma2 family endonuclease
MPVLALHPMPSPAPSLRLTYEDYLELPADGKRHELIDGDLYVTPAPTSRHQAVLRNLLRILGTFVHQTRRGALFPSPLDVVLSPNDVVQPDLLFVAADRLRLITDTHVAGAPDLAVEIFSPSSRRTDARTKLRLYERYGVREYWLVDPELETIAVYRLDGGVYRQQAGLELERGDVLTSPLFTGLTISLAEVFE